MRICVIPSKQQLPSYGGVLEHMLQLYKCIANCNDIQLVDCNHADVTHVESAYRSPDKVDVYVCHGGFTPIPLQPVAYNLQRAAIIVSVAEWVARKYFPSMLNKTIVMPNGVDLSEWKDAGSFWLSGYILYAKQYVYFMEDFCWLASQLPQIKFVTTVWPDRMAVPSNVHITGLQTKEEIRALLHRAKFLMLTGSEVCPTMVLEAWACGTPVLSKSGTGAEEFMHYGSPTGKPTVDGGILYDSRNDLLEAAQWLAANKEIQGRLGYNKVVKYYQWQDLFDEKYIPAYKAVVEKRVPEFLREYSLAARS
jgi:glycosyltransferase involved in cell wall biosynthesis